MSKRRGKWSCCASFFQFDIKREITGLSKNINSNENYKNMKIGEHISSQRKRKGITQETLSELSGISLRTIQRIESDKSTPRAFTLKILTDQLGLDMKEITEIQNESMTAISKYTYNNCTQKMNLAGLAVILMPVLPLLIATAIWIRNKNSGANNFTEKRIISFQLIWIVLTFFVMATTKIINYYLTGVHVNGHMSPLLPIYVLMVTFNLITIIYSALKLQKQELGIIYQFTPSLF
jgi:XRE family transcriptional regulator, regulator of sulfur utilization